MFKHKNLATLMAIVIASSPAWADDTIVQLKFEGLTVPVTDTTTGETTRPNVVVDNFYNGGRARNAQGVEVGPNGPDYNIVISGSNASVFALESFQSPTVGAGSFVANPAIGGSGALGIVNNGFATISFVDGASFDGKLSFYFSADGTDPLTVTIGGANPLLRGPSFTQTFQFNGDPTCTGSAGAFCNWQLVEFDLGHPGQATEVTLSGNRVFIDNLTLGSINPANLPETPAVPEPSTYAMLVFGLAAVGVAAKRRQRRV